MQQLVQVALSSLGGEKLQPSLTRLFAFLFIIRLITSPLFLQAQIGAQFQQGVGSIWRHSDKIIPNTNQAIYENSLLLEWQTDGRKYWQQQHNFPIIGLEISRLHLNAPRILGDAYALRASYRNYYYQNQHWKLYYQALFGASYFTRPYDAISNPDNNLIGSHFNAGLSIKAGATYQLATNWQAHIALAGTHYSNAAFRNPNLGINYPAIYLGMAYQWNKSNQKRLRKQNPTPTSESNSKNNLPSKRWYVGASSMLGTAEMGKTIGGAIYPIYVVTVHGGYDVHPLHRLHIGLEYEYNTRTAEFLQHIFVATTPSAAQSFATNWLLFVADEIFIGDLSVFLSEGVTLSIDRDGESVLYTRLGLRYYIVNNRPSQPSGLQWHIGIYFKAEQITAKYYGFGTGLVF